jgi:hypothetical protein
MRRGSRDGSNFQRIKKSPFQFQFRFPKSVMAGRTPLPKDRALLGDDFTSIPPETVIPEVFPFCLSPKEYPGQAVILTRRRSGTFPFKWEWLSGYRIDIDFIVLHSNMETRIKNTRRGKNEN